MTADHTPATQAVDIVIIGAGFAGLGAAWQLLAHGLSDFVVLERADEVGGTWRDNTYPGAACDIRSDLYSYSFAPNPAWRTAFGQQPEILNYLRTVSGQHGIRDHIRFGTEMLRASWDSAGRCWRLETSGGTVTARMLLSGHGPLVDPHRPDIEGLDSFAGAVFHSSRWDHSIDVHGKRVAVIGTGASAVQIVPAIAPWVAHLALFQRTPAWIIPRHDRTTSALRRRIFGAAPVVQRASRSLTFLANDSRWFGFTHPRVGALLERYAGWHLRSQVADPHLRELLRPGYRIGCKRVLVSDDFYPALQKPNVELITDSIARIDPDAVITTDGRRAEVDLIVCATGFDATRPAIADRIVGVDGATLASAWAEGMFALRGAAVPGFPNLFLLHGPNGALSHNSAIFMIEAQIGYAIDALRRTPPGAVIEATSHAADRYRRGLEGPLARGPWSTGSCSSYFLDPVSGRNTFLWPRPAAAFRKALRTFEPSEYSIS